MNRSIRLAVMVPLAAIAFTLLALAAREARAAESYDGCAGTISSLPAVISSQGTWCMKTDLSTAMASGNAITVQANNVTIDCNHFKLSGLAAGAGSQAYGIYAHDRVSVSVRNCNIRGFRDGVYLVGSGYSAYDIGGSHLVEDSRFESNWRTGITVMGVGSIVRENIVVDSGDSTIPGSTFAAGIYVYSGGDIYDNYVWGVTSGIDAVDTVGIEFVSNGTSVAITGNKVHLPMNGDADEAYGIRVRGTGNRFIVGNQVSVDGYAPTSVGISCQYDGGQLAKDNAIGGTLTRIDTCTDGGGNAW